MKIEGNLVDVLKEEIYPARIVFDKKITKVERTRKNYENYILPGFIDSHIHIESSMLCPSRFSEVVIPFGTTSVISDPHEIANVLGIKGIEYTISDSRSTPLKIYFTAPSCVPATKFETSGGKIGVKEIERLLRRKEIVALGEVMNFPGVIRGDEELLKKIEAAKTHRKPIDGHCPKLSGDSLKKYVSTGISTDHESTTYEEAKEKAKLGMKIMIREGSSSKDMRNLIGIAKNFESFFVTDDLHPNDLMKGHMDRILRRAIRLGLDPIKAIKAVTLNPSLHYNLNSGSISLGKDSDILEVSDLRDFEVKRVFINGKLVAKDGKALFKAKPKEIGTTFKVRKTRERDFVIKGKRRKETVKVIGAKDKSLITKELEAELEVRDGQIISDVKKDILKISVVERYGHNRMSKGFVRGFGLKRGAIASSVSHDSHNIIVVGCNNKSIAKAVNTIIRMKGGLVAVDGKSVKLELPIAGLMSTEDAKVISKKLNRLNEFTKGLGCNLHSPFGTLSFLSLLVIPELKISDRGLFDSRNFEFVKVVK
jgi:adenine deaminase